MDYVITDPSFFNITKAWKYLKGVSNFLDIFSVFPQCYMLTSQCSSQFHIFTIHFNFSSTL